MAMWWLEGNRYMHSGQLTDEVCYLFFNVVVNSTDQRVFLSRISPIPRSCNWSIGCGTVASQLDLIIRLPEAAKKFGLQMDRPSHLSTSFHMSAWVSLLQQ